MESYLEAVQHSGLSHHLKVQEGTLPFEAYIDFPSSCSIFINDLSIVNILEEELTFITLDAVSHLHSTQVDTSFGIVSTWIILRTVLIQVDKFGEKLLRDKAQIVIKTFLLNIALKVVVAYPEEEPSLGQ